MKNKIIICYGIMLVLLFSMFVFGAEQVYVFERKLGGFGSSEFLFNNLGNVDVNSENYLVVTDYGNKMIKVYNEKGYFEKWIDNNCCETNALDPFIPVSVTISSKDEIYVADRMGGIGNVKVLNSQGVLQRMIGHGKISSDDDREKRTQKPNKIIINSQNNVIILDKRVVAEWGASVKVYKNQHDVLVYDEQGNFLFKIGFKHCDIMSPNNDECIGKFKDIKDIAIDSKDRIIILDSTNVQIFDSNGKFIKKIGYIAPGVNEFNNPLSVAVDSKDNIIIADTGNNKIKVYSPGFSNIFNFGSECDLSMLTDPSFTQTCKHFPSAPMCQNHPAKKCHTEFEGAVEKGDGQFKYPSFVAVDSQDNIIVVDKNNHRLQIFDSSGKFLQKIGSLGQGDAEFGRHGPDYITFDNNGDMIVVDNGNSRIQFFDFKGEVVVNDKDGDGFDSNEHGGADCDDTSQQINPSASEICDGVDNDCNGAIDEGCGCEHNIEEFDVVCGIGECEIIIPIRQCIFGEWDNKCPNLEFSPLKQDENTVEKCKDGLDNDCDGVVDALDDDCVDVDDVGVDDIEISKEITLSLHKGWNVMPLTIEPDVKEIDKALGSVMDSVVIIREYGADDVYVFDPKIPARFNSLKTIVGGKAYQVKMKNGAELVISGTSFTKTSVSLHKGWNMMPYLGGSILGIDDVIGSVKDNIVIIRDYGADDVFVFDPKIPARFNSLKEFQPETGYQVKMKDVGEVDFG